MSENTFHIGDAVCPLCREPIKMAHHDNLGDGESMVCMRPKAAPNASLAEPWRTSPERCHAWLSTFAMLDDAADHLAELLDTVVIQTLKDAEAAQKAGIPWRAGPSSGITHLETLTWRAIAHCPEDLAEALRVALRAARSGCVDR